MSVRTSFLLQDSTHLKKVDSCICPKAKVKSSVITKTAPQPGGAENHEQKVNNTILIQEPNQPATACEWYPIVGHLAWPITVIIVLIVIRGRLFNFLDILTRRIKNSNFRISTHGLEVTSASFVHEPWLVGKMDSMKLANDISYEQTTEYLECRRVLSTLWLHQLEYDTKKDLSIRWGFRLPENHPDENAFEILLSLGLVSLNPENNLYFLSNLGYEYCRKFANRLQLGNFSYFTLYNEDF